MNGDLKAGKPFLLAPSILSANPLAVGEALRSLEGEGDWIHVDIMDGHYVKNITLSPFFVESIRAACKLPIDCHLMVTNPEDFVDVLAKAGADYIVPHAETINAQAFRIIDMIHSHKCKAGVAINPATPVSVLLPYIHRLDKITVMSVDPGFAGQPFIPEVLPKITELKNLKAEKGYSYLIEVDGSCNSKTFKRLYDAGAEVYIVGSSGLFNNDPDLAKAWDIMTDAFYKETGCKA